MRQRAILGNSGQNFQWSGQATMTALGKIKNPAAAATAADSSVKKKMCSRGEEIWRNPWNC
jgi:hypothetical protein